MADVIVDLVAPEEVAEVTSLYNRIFRPSRVTADFVRRYQGRRDIVQMVARIREEPIGFLLGFELKPRTFFLWFVGVLPENRRQGVASQLLDALHSWGRMNDYEYIRCEFFNQQRQMLQLAIAQEYDIVGVRYDPDHGENLVLMQKAL